MTTTSSSGFITVKMSLVEKKCAPVKEYSINFSDNPIPLGKIAEIVRSSSLLTKAQRFIKNAYLTIIPSDSSL